MQNSVFSSRVNKRKLLADVKQRSRMSAKRKWRDSLSKLMISLAGITVVCTLLGMFVFFLIETAPLFPAAKLQATARYPIALAAGEAPLHVQINREDNAFTVLTDKANLYRFALSDGALQAHHAIALKDANSLNVLANTHSGLLLGLGESAGVVLANMQPFASISGMGVEYLVNTSAAFADKPVKKLTVVAYKEGLALVAWQADQLLLLKTENVSEIAKAEQFVINNVAQTIRYVLLDASLRHLYVIDDQGVLHHYSGQFPHKMEKVARTALVSKGNQLNDVKWLAGGVAFITASSDGRVTQWMPVRDNLGHWRVTRVHTFTQHVKPVQQLASEQARRVFASIDQQGKLNLHHATSASTLASTSVEAMYNALLSFSPSNKFLVLVNAHEAQVVAVDNAHPEISWKSLWQELWYEGRQQPALVWQSTSASDVFEPKFSLTPLLSGSLKAALYSLLFAVPLAVMAAIYTAYFMKANLRGKIKPTIEMMEAMPTVILGFIAGLWLAPFIEQHLPALLLLALLLPASMLACSFIFSHTLASYIGRRIYGVEVLLLLPCCVGVVLLSVWLSPHIESVFFAGSMQQWLNDQGVSYDQRNAIIVGMAMGFAIIPTIYTLAEDAIYHVPRHLSVASMALGASRWQTLWRVVLLTASPGIFSAIMLGLGRAFGETMIVLMATGNNPVLGFNPLESMRTLAATVAMELPEAAIDTSHYRLLFLAALMLFVFSFAANTLAEIVRQQLRRRYSAMQAGL